jgi:hypothetical protein
VVVVLDILQRERGFALAILLASLGFAATLALVNVDGFIVRQNVARAPEGKGLDVAYLASLSSDSVPVLVAEFRDPSLPGLTRDAVGAVLVCYEQQGAGGGADDWRSFTLSTWRADQDLRKVQDQLDQYQVVNQDWPISILTPGSVDYDCHQTGGG